MLKKVCPNCRQASYSASEFGLWICPSCEHNLRYIPTEPAEPIDDITECFWCDGRMAKMHDGVLVCSDCGWRYKGKESEVEEG